VQQDDTHAKMLKGRLTKRVLWGFALALAVALSAYLLFSFSKAGSMWFASLWFLALLPALLCALICYIGDPDQNPASRLLLVDPASACRNCRRWFGPVPA